MAKYRIEGKVYEASTPDEAYAMHDQAVTYNPTAGMSGFDKFAAGMGQGMTNVGRQVGNILGMVSDEELAEAKKTDQALLDTGAGQAGAFVGEMAATAPVGGAVGGLARGAGRMLPSALGRMGGSRLAGYGAEGAAEGAILAGPEGRGEGALMGAGIGAGVGKGMDVLGGMARGVQRTPGAQRLIDEGVDLTPGQINPGGKMAAIEESAAGRIAPGVTAAREAAKEDVLTAALNRSRAPGTEQIAKASDPNDMLDAAYEGFKPAYDSAKGHALARGNLDEGVLQKVLDFPGVTNEVREAEFGWVDNQLSRLGDSKNIKTDDLLKIRSEVRDRIRKVSKAGDWERADILEAVEDSLSSRIDQALPADAQQLLRSTDQQYAKFKTVEDMVWRAGDRGFPTPFQMSSAVKQAAPNRGAYTRGGGGELRQLTKDAAQQFAENTPKTGMANYIPAATAGLGYAAAGPMGAVGGAALPTAIAALGSGTRTGRRAARGQLPPQRAAQAVIDQTRNLQYLPRAGAVTYGTSENNY